MVCCKERVWYAQPLGVRAYHTHPGRKDAHGNEHLHSQLFGLIACHPWCPHGPIKRVGD